MNATDLAAVKEYVSTLGRSELRLLMQIALKEGLALEWILLAHKKTQNLSASLDLNKYNFQDKFQKVRKYHDALISKYKKMVVSQRVGSRLKFHLIKKKLILNFRILKKIYIQPEIMSAINVIKQAIEDYVSFMKYDSYYDNLTFYEVYFYSQGITDTTEHNVTTDYNNPNSFFECYH